jgi:hypothetical protein
MNGNITETVTILYTGGPSTREVMEAPAVNSSTGEVTLTWSSVEGGTYQVDASDTLQAWSILSAAKPAASNAIQTRFKETGASFLHPNRFYRIKRTSLATYDPAYTGQ